jgi:IclR family transcriptional regulator, KDG regulon repressor
MVFHMVELKTMVQSLDRAFRILDTISCHKEGIGVVALAAEVGLPPSTTHRLVTNLVRYGYVRQDEKTEKYHVGPKVMDLAQRTMEDHDLRSASRPFLKEMKERTGETAHLMILDENRVLCIESVESSGHIKVTSPVGLRESLHCSAVGKALLAYQPKEIQDQLLISPLQIFTPNTISTLKEMRAHLEGVNAAGGAFDHEERHLGVSCVAAPVFNRQGQVLAAVGISAPSVRMSAGQEKEWAVVVKDLAEKISRTIPVFL